MPLGAPITIGINGIAGGSALPAAAPTPPAPAPAPGGGHGFIGFLQDFFGITVDPKRTIPVRPNIWFLTWLGPQALGGATDNSVFGLPPGLHFTDTLQALVDPNKLDQVIIDFETHRQIVSGENARLHRAFLATLSGADLNAVIRSIAGADNPPDEEHQVILVQALLEQRQRSRELRRTLDNIGQAVAVPLSIALNPGDPGRPNQTNRYTPCRLPPDNRKQG